MAVVEGYRIDVATDHLSNNGSPPSYSFMYGAENAGLVRRATRPTSGNVYKVLRQDVRYAVRLMSWWTPRPGHRVETAGLGSVEG